MGADLDQFGMSSSVYMGMGELFTVPGRYMMEHLRANIVI
jgi:hypothetical protein